MARRGVRQRRLSHRIPTHGQELRLTPRRAGSHAASFGAQTALRAASVELRNDLDEPNDVVVELVKVIGRDPVLENGLASSLLNVVPV